MAKAVLRDDLPFRRGKNVGSVKVGLDNDGCAPCSVSTPTTSDPGVTTPPVSGGVNPVLTVRRRNRTGYDDNGNPTFEWSTIVTGAAIVWSERSEFDAVEGATKVEARAEMLYVGGMDVPETVAVFDDDGNQWRVTKVWQVADRLGLTIDRIDMEAT